MYNWFSFSKDPTNIETAKGFKKFLLSIRSILFIERDKYFLSECENKKVLDIGPCEHTLHYIQSEGWFFRRAQKVASRIVGVDINKELCEKVFAMGYDIRNIDACSDTFLNEKFDVVIAGDVIEHVNDLTSLLSFAKRHLAEDGKIIFSTPNPFFYRHFLSNFNNDQICMVNFEHTCWITPTCMNELCRRVDLNFSKYIMCINPNSFKYYMMKFLPFTRSWIEGVAKEYIYVLEDRIC